MADPESEISDHAGGRDAAARRRVDPPTGAREAVRETGGFDGFFLERHDAMVRALTLTLGDLELGRDAASEGFARALQRWNRVARYSNPAGWVYRVGLNWALSRRRKSRRELLVGNAPTGDRRTASPAPADPSIAAALKTLSIEHRAVVVGRYYLDWSERELAAALGVAPGTVKSRLSRALARLQEILPERTPADEQDDADEADEAGEQDGEDDIG